MAASGNQSAHALNDSTVATPSVQQAAAHTRAASPCDQLKAVFSGATASSSSEMAEPSAATTNRRKNAAAATVPNGIRAKASGRVTNTSPGPLDGSSPSANTMGNTAKPASSEIAVSAAIVKSATCLRLISGLA